MEPLNYFSISVIMVAISLMAIQNMTMLKDKWKGCYLGILFFKLLLTYINANYPNMMPMPGVDGGSFTKYAFKILADYPNSFLGILLSDSSLFAKETAFVFYVFGVNPVYMYFLVCFCSLIAFKYMVLMMNEMTENYDLAQKCGLIFLVWPMLLLHASSFLRENQCQLLCILSFYQFVLFVKKHNLVNFAFAVIWSVFAALTHSGMIALLVCYCIFGSMISKTGDIKFSPIKIVFGFILLFGLMSSPYGGEMTSEFAAVEGVRSIDEFAEGVSKDALEAGTQYISSIPSNPIKLLLTEPYLFLMFIFSPLPYQIHSSGQGVAFLIEAIPQFFIVRATFIYLVVKRKKGTSQIRGYKVVGLWTLLLFYFIYSLGVTCYGTAMRHRAKITPLVLAFASMYYAEKKESEEDEGEDSQKKRIRRQIKTYKRPQVVGSAGQVEAGKRQRFIRPMGRIKGPKIP